MTGRVIKPRRLKVGVNATRCRSAPRVADQNGLQQLAVGQTVTAEMTAGGLRELLAVVAGAAAWRHFDEESLWTWDGAESWMLRGN